MNEIKKSQNRERVRKHRDMVMQDDDKRKAVLEKDRERKAAARKAFPLAEVPNAKLEEVRRKDRERHQKSRRLLKEEGYDRRKETGKRLTKKTLRDKNKLIGNLQKKVIKLEKQVISHDIKKSNDVSSLEELKEVLTPRSMRKIRSSLSAKGKQKARKLGLRIRTYGSTRKRIRTDAKRKLFPEVIDLSKDLPEDNNDDCLNKTTQEAVVEFALKNSCDIPDVKKMKLLKLSEGDGDHKERVPVRFRYDTLDILHSIFLSEHPDIDIAYSTFSRNFPTETVILPKSEEWGTALCVKCLNPRLKAEALQKAGCTSKSADELCESMVLVTTKLPIVSSYWDLQLTESIPKQIKFLKWIKVDADGSSVKVDRKVEITKDCGTFKAEFVRDLRSLKEHRDLIHAQYSAVKEEKQSLESDSEKAIIQLDWSTNFAIKQSRQTQAAFFFNTQIALHPMVIWVKHGTSSVCTISDETTHKASATWAGLVLSLKSLVEEKFTKIVLISDSPTSQYRNRFTIGLLRDFMEHNPSLSYVKWIYLESGHGKGASDGVGASVKQKLKLITSKGDNVDFSAQELMQSYEKEQQSVKMFLYTSKDVEAVKNSDVYKNTPALAGIGGCHEVTVTAVKTVLKQKCQGRVIKEFWEKTPRTLQSLQTSQPGHQSAETPIGSLSKTPNVPQTQSSTSTENPPTRRGRKPAKKNVNPKNKTKDKGMIASKKRKKSAKVVPTNVKASGSDAASTSTDLSERSYIPLPIMITEDHSDDNDTETQPFPEYWVPQPPSIISTESSEPQPITLVNPIYSLPDLYSHAEADNNLPYQGYFLNEVMKIGGAMHQSSTGRIQTSPTSSSQHQFNLPLMTEYSKLIDPSNLLISMEEAILSAQNLHQQDTPKEQSESDLGSGSTPNITDMDNVSTEPTESVKDKLPKHVQVQVQVPPLDKFSILDWVLVRFQTLKGRWVHYVGRIVGIEIEVPNPEEAPLEPIIVSCYTKHMDPRREHTFKKIKEDDYFFEKNIIVKLPNPTMLAKGIIHFGPEFNDIIMSQNDITLM